MKEPRIKSVMTPFPYSVELQAPIGEAQRLMLEHHVHHLAVTEHFELRGIVSDRDLKLLLSTELTTPDSPEPTVEDAYVDEYYAVELETTLSAALDNMAVHHIDATIVTSHGRLAGIFTAMDACRAFRDHLETQFHKNDPPEVA